MTLRKIDSERRSHLFVFLYENNLLPDQTKSSGTISLEEADFYNITIINPIASQYVFKSISFESVNLVNSTFIGCTFRKGRHLLIRSFYVKQAWDLRIFSIELH